MSYQDLKHLKTDHINHLALCLDEDVYCANGDLDDEEIETRVIENIHEATGHRYADGGYIPSIPLRTAARLIISVWQSKDRDYMQALSEANKPYKPLPTVEEVEASISNS
jgi:hypothetical protein